MTRKLWILSRGKLNSSILGPMLRLVEMARYAIKQEYSVTIAIDAIESPPIPGITFSTLTPAILELIKPGDIVIISPFLPPAFLFKFLRLRIPFDVDFYCVGALENLESGHQYSDLRLFQGRRRTALRYRILIERASYIYVSNNEQITFLGGLLFQQSDSNACKIAAALPSKSLIMPMGVSVEEFPKQPSPYPNHLEGRHIFLWGGGIWSWFDIPTLLRSFKILQTQKSKAALYFLCGTNPSGLAEQDDAILQAIEYSKELGIFGDYVFFNDGPVAYKSLPGYLAHCRAGVMSNPPRLESIASWRTRILDLLWAGKPLITSGYDPLSNQMKDAKAARLVNSESPTEFASEIQEICDNQEICNSMSSASTRFAQSMTWNITLSAWSRRLSQDQLPNHVPKKINSVIIFRYLIGI